MLRYLYGAELPEDKAEDLLFLKTMHQAADFYDVPNLRASTLSKFCRSLERIIFTEANLQIAPLNRSV